MIFVKLLAFIGRTVDGRVLARYGSVIVAVINYRTGILGFLNSGDDEINGMSDSL